ncbi:MAG: hypothetical protein M3N22_11575, partial [Acidobacteriota bacterium]|nr:hypothetical protein [Acidobacteriota bacterium]
MEETKETVAMAAYAGTRQRPGEAPGDGGFLWDFWYPAVRSDEIYGKNLATAMLLEVPLVIGRTT